ncbi:MAG: hypothetical protein KKA55_00880 [Proteobacteria bacterium]|nr:hypothetical protein [Pseudomonadota bacterium]MBU1594071.1 hypothetical protein [Pseudomonadota bacterium]
MKTMKAQSAKAPAPKAKAPAPKAKAPAPKAMSMVPAKTVTKAVAKTPKKKSGREALLARVEAVRLSQRQEGHFDCFGRADSGYCDQGACTHHAECLSVSQMLHSM